MMNTLSDGVIWLALAEDTAKGDITSEILISRNWHSSAFIQAKEKGILAGTMAARSVFNRIDPELDFNSLVKDGEQVERGHKIITLSGRITSILKAERTALNFLQHLSGIATETARYVAAVRGLKVKILDTRKTTPGLREMEKEAVKLGGAKNHRLNLSDAILIKDNHIAVLKNRGWELGDIILKAKKKAGKKRIEVEVKTLSEAREAAEGGADIIMLDNMKPTKMRRVIQELKGECLFEASGGVNLNNVRKVAETGVDYISIGAITHSAKALDLSLELIIK